MVVHKVNGYEFEVDGSKITCKEANLTYTIRKDGGRSLSQKKAIPANDLLPLLQAIDVVVEKIM